MAAKITGASLQPILSRLNSIPNYHPFEADAFSDWSMESGDIIGVAREGESYSSPVSSTRMVWKGNSPTVQIKSTGEKERESVAKTSRKKYGRGSAGVRSQENIYRQFTSPDGLLHSELEISESHIRTEFDDVANSLRSEFEITASHLRTEFGDISNSLRSEFEVTASHLRTEFDDRANSLRGEFEVSASHLRTEFNDKTNSLRGEFEVSASHLRTEFNDKTNSLRSEFEVTASHLRNEFINETSSLRSEFEITASHMRDEFIDETNSLRSEFEITASHLRYEFNDEIGSVRSYMHQTASSWETRVEGVIDENGNITAASICLAVNDGQSTATINANKIYMLGQTILNTVDANYITTTIENANQLNVQRLNANVITITPISGGDAIGVQNAIKDINISLSNNTYTLQYKRFYDSDWQSVTQTFSRATSLSGEWASGVFTTTASPQGDTLTTSLTNTGHWGSEANNEDPTHYYYKTYATIGNGSVPVDTENVYEIDASTKLQDKTENNKFTSNGTYTADSGYIGYGEITIDVPQGTISQDVQVRFNGSSGSYYIEAFDSVSGNPISGASKIYRLGLSGTNVQVQDASGTLIGAQYTIPLQSSRTLTSNGTYTPSSGNVGMASVTVDVPSDLPNARTRFSGSSGQYYVESFDSVSGNSISGSSVTYKLGTSGASVQIQNSSGSQISGTPTLALTIDSGSVDANGSRTLTVVAGGVNTTRTATITDYAGGWAAAYAKVTLPANNTETGFMVVKTPPSTVGGNATETTYTLDTSDKNIAYIKQGSSVKAQVTHNRYNGGWAAAYAKVTLPANNTSSGYMVVKTPPSTVDGNATETTYTLDTSDKNIAYIKQGSSIKAQVTHNRYNGGWAAAYAKVSLPANNTSSGTMVVKTPPSTVDGNATSTTYTLDTSNKNIAYIKQGSSIKAQVTHNRYNGGWNAAYGKVSLPANNTSTGYMTVKTPPSTVDGNATETTYTLDTSNANIAYIKQGSSVKAQVTHNHYTNGKNDVWNGVSIVNTCGDPSSYTTVSGSGANKVVRFAFTTTVSSSGMSNKTKNDYWQGIPTQIWQDAYAAGISASTGGLTIRNTETYTDSSGFHYKIASGSYYSTVVQQPFKTTVNNSGGTAVVTKDDYWQGTPTAIWQKAFKSGWQAALSSTSSYWWYGKETIDNVKYWTVWTPKSDAYSSAGSPSSSYGERWEAAKTPLYEDTITLRQANGYAGARHMIMYFKDNQGNYQTASGASTAMYWYFSSKDIGNTGSFKTFHY